MPSRLSVGLILAFWLAVTGFVVDRDVLPRLRSDAPPAIRIDLSDEATQTVPARWSVWRGGQQVGLLQTRMSYVAADDTFQFVSTYRNLRFDVSGLRCEVPELTITLRVGRDGDLRAQDMAGKLKGMVAAGPVTVFEAEATADVSGVVRDGFLYGHVRLKSPLGDIDQLLDPVPVPQGQVLNPLQPVNRLRDVRPGRRWVVYEVNPLADALAALAQGLLKKHAGAALAGMAADSGKREPLVAQVSDRPEVLTRKGDKEVPCWVIEYRGEKASAKTWVAVDDGKVLRQEATGQGEALRLERED